MKQYFVVTRIQQKAFDRALYDYLAHGFYSVDILSAARFTEYSQAQSTIEAELKNNPDAYFQIDKVFATL